jgi:hypothetical protein
MEAGMQCCAWKQACRAVQGNKHLKHFTAHAIMLHGVARFSAVHKFTS